MANLIDDHGNPIQLADEHGNPVHLTDEHGNAMQLTGIATSPGKTPAATTAYGGAPDSGLKMDTPYGTTAPGSGMTTGTGTHDVGFGTSTGGAPGSGLRTDAPYGPTLGSGMMTGTGTHDASIMATGIIAGQDMYGAAPTSHNAMGQHQREGPIEFQRSTSSSSSSSEDDGQGGRRKKKGLNQKIKEKLTGKHEEEQSQSISVSNTTTTTTMKATFTAEEVSPTGQGQHQHHDSHEKKSFMKKIKEKLPGHHSH